MNGIGIGSGIISQSKNSLPVPFKLRARKNGGSRGKTDRGCETVPRAKRKGWFTLSTEATEAES